MLILSKKKNNIPEKCIFCKQFTDCISIDKQNISEKELKKIKRKYTISNEKKERKLEKAIKKNIENSGQACPELIPVEFLKINGIAKRAYSNPYSLKVINDTLKKNKELYMEDYEKLYMNPCLDDCLMKFCVMPRDLKEKERKNKDISYKKYIKYAILGDIIGSIYEFTEHGPIKNLILDKSFYTDDTVLTIATMKAIQENDKNPNFRKWYLKYFNKYQDKGYGSTFYNWAQMEILKGTTKDDNKPGYNSLGNGSAMRVAYIGLYYDNVQDVIKNAYLSAMVTHNHYQGVEAAIVIAVCTWMAKVGYNKEDIYKYVYRKYHHDKSEIAIFKQFDFCYYDFNDEYPEITKKQRQDVTLYAAYAVPYTIDKIRKTNNFEECMHLILSEFCDADTICAIAGPIAALLNENEYLSETEIDKILKEKLDNELWEELNNLLK